ncbi:MAG TPA: hypothetical protein VNT01_11375 [Symbiobacteriaceae bacterium]|nr:hypothetical protein [Symbiobacteriaceae bacterium]
MAKGTGSDSQGTAPGGKRLNLASVVRQTKGMNGTEVTITAGSFQAFSSVLGTPLFEQAALEGKLKHTRPGFLSMGDLDGQPGVLVGTPCMTEDETTAKVRWDEKNSQVIIDMMATMSLIHFEVPAESTAHIPIVYRNVTGFGPSVLFFFSQATYEPIVRTGPRKPKSTDKGVAKGTGKPDEKK